MLWTSVEGCRNPDPTAYLVGVQPLVAARYIVPSPCATATKVGAGWVCQPVKPPGWIVSTWNTMSQAAAPQALSGCTPGSWNLTRDLTVPCFVFTRTVRVIVTFRGVPRTICGAAAPPSVPR